MTNEHECACGGSCGCGGHETEQNYLSRDEYITRLEAYLVDLRNEISAVEGELEALRQPSN